MKRIAYASPLNPAPSGISDYSEELLPYLGQYADITLYIDDGLRPTNPELIRNLEVRPLSRLKRDQRHKPYDAILYHIGNSPVHASIWRALQRVPGVVVLHEFVLHHFMLQYYATVQGDIERYRAEAARRYGPEGERIAHLMMHGRFTEAAFNFPFCEDVLAAAEGLIAHSRYVLDSAARLRPDLPQALVPMGVPLPPAIERDAARARRGLTSNGPILASFGHINPYKRIEPVLRALRALCNDYPDIHYLLVGSVSPSYNIRTVIERSGMADRVTVTGYVDRTAFEEYVAAADLCLNLRHPTAGETSASLLRLLGAGRPTLVTSSGSFAELPADVAAQVDPDASEGDLIQAYCRLLLSQPELAATLGANARAFVAEQHTLAGAAAKMIRFLAMRYGWGEIAPVREQPLWNIEQPDAPGKPPTTLTSVYRTLEAIPEPPGTLPAAVGAALAELGATEEDTSLLHSVAQRMSEL